MTRDSAANTLVLYANYTDQLSYYDDWLDAFRASSLMRVTAENIVSHGARRKIADAMREVELIVLLHSTNADTTRHLEPIADLLADRRCPLVGFIGNEVNLPSSPIAAKRAVLGKIRPDFIATQLLPEAGRHLWGDLTSREVLPLPHALNPHVFKLGAPLSKRPVDVGVRAARYLPHLGDRDRNRVHELFATHTFAPDLNVDIGTGRFDREGWARFLQNCRATVSSEAGSWWLEHDDATVEAIGAWAKELLSGRAVVISHDSPLGRAASKLPVWTRKLLRRLLKGGVLRPEAMVAEELPFEEVYARFFANRSLPEYYGKCISSRHFDAAGTGALMILLEGRYNDLLTPGEHYVQLKKDFSNIEDVMAVFHNPKQRQLIADAAHAYVLEAHTYAHRIANLHASLA